MHTPSTPIVSSLSLDLEARAGMRRDYLLPDDEFAGVALVQAAAAWGTLGATVFVRRRVLAPDVCHVSMLRFDEDGFGTVSFGLADAGSLPAELALAVAQASKVVLLSDETDDAIAGLCVGPLERRGFEVVHAFGSRELGLVREGADLSAEVWSEARSGDPIAAMRMQAPAKADLLTLVAMAGRALTLH